MAPFIKNIDTSINWILGRTCNPETQKKIDSNLGEKFDFYKLLLNGIETSISLEIFFVIFEVYFDLWADPNHAVTLEWYSILYFLEHKNHWVQSIFESYCIRNNYSLNNLNEPVKVKINQKFQQYLINRYLKQVNY